MDEMTENNFSLWWMDSATPSSALGLFLALFSGVTSGGDQGTISGARESNWMGGP